MTQLYIITVKDAYGIQYSYERFLTNSQVHLLESDGCSVRAVKSVSDKLKLRAS